MFQDTSCPGDFHSSILYWGSTRQVTSSFLVLGFLHGTLLGGDIRLAGKSKQHNRRTCVCTKLLQSCLTLCIPMDPRILCPWDSLGNNGVGCHALFQGSSWPKDWTHVSYVSCIGRQVLYQLAPPGKPGGHGDDAIINYVEKIKFYLLFSLTSVKSTRYLWP